MSIKSFALKQRHKSDFHIIIRMSVTLGDTK